LARYKLLKNLKIIKKGFGERWKVKTDKQTNMKLRESAWRALEALYKEKKIKAIGISK
jgi:diketogulonate reductase-like aldo/keto reductase